MFAVSCEFSAGLDGLACQCQLVSCFSAAGGGGGGCIGGTFSWLLFFSDRFTRSTPTHQQQTGPPRLGSPIHQRFENFASDFMPPASASSSAVATAAAAAAAAAGKKSRKISLHKVDFLSIHPFSFFFIITFTLFKLLRRMYFYIEKETNVWLSPLFGRESKQNKTKSNKINAEDVPWLIFFFYSSR